MRLWSWQQPDFSLTDGRVDLERSEFVLTVEGVRKAYRALSERFGTDQFIWCYTEPDSYLTAAGDTRVRWSLEVPPAQIVAFLDCIVWERILGRYDCYGPFLTEWHHEAIRRYGGGLASERYVREHIEAFRNEPPPPDGGRSYLSARKVAIPCTP
jgi:hypothetical protein